MNALDTTTRRSGKLIALAAAALASFGCASTGAGSTAAYQPAQTGPVHHHLGGRHANRVEVFLDSEPARPFLVTGEFAIKTANNPSSIEAMRESAAEAGLDGIYWIDCTSPCSGSCTAKGFKYVEADVTNIATR